MSEAPRRFRASARAGLLAVSAILPAAGLLLWLLAAPTLAALTALPGDPWLKKVRSGDAVPPQAVETILRSRLRALSWSEQPRALSDLALAELMLAEQTPEDAARLRSRAIANLEDALAAAPARAFVWTRLAHARQQADPADRALVPALEQAMRSAPFSARLLLPRLEIAFRAWPALDEPLREAFRAQMRQAALRQESTEALVEMAWHSQRLNTLRLAVLPELRTLWRVEREIDRQLATQD